MAVVKVIEILAESNKSWEDATKAAVAEAAKTIRNIQTVYIKSFQAVVENNEVVRYRVDAKISFIVKEQVLMCLQDTAGANVYLLIFKTGAGPQKMGPVRPCENEQ